MDEARLVEKLRRIEALHAGATNEGERIAAEEALRRIRERLRDTADREPPVEYRFGLSDPWSRRVLLALLRRYGIEPYRYRGQRRTTIMAKVPRRFVDEILWPEYLAIAKTLHRFVEEATDRVIAEALHADRSEPAEVAESARLGPATGTSEELD